MKLKIKRRGISSAVIGDDGKVVSPRLFVTGEITSTITATSFVNDVDSLKSLLKNLKVGSDVEVYARVTEDGATFYNLERPDLSDEDILKVAGSEPVAKVAKSKAVKKNNLFQK